VIALFLLLQSVTVFLRCELDSAAKTVLCVEAKPEAPCPTPTPAPSPTPVPTPTPPPKDGTLAYVGVSKDLRRKGVSKETQAQGYYHTAFTLDTTPHAIAPNCEHAPDRRTCEQAKDEQDKRGSQLWMKHPAWGNTWHEAVRSSQNAYQFRHKPRKHEIGRTEFLACAYGERPGHPTCGGDGPGRPRVLDIR
jgi:hypothetical protein